MLSLVERGLNNTACQRDKHGKGRSSALGLSSTHGLQSGVGPLLCGEICQIVVFPGLKAAIRQFPQQNRSLSAVDRIYNQLD
jgi:hypothetical protein